MRVTRRQVLRGLGGLTVALPLLPSLFEGSEAKAASPPGTKRFIALRSEHGALLGSNMYPADSALTQQQAYAGYQVRRGDLPLVVNGATSSISPVLTGPSDKLTAALAAKMNVLRGLDLGFYIAHHRGGSLGNFGDSTDNQREPHVTADQVLAWSPKFYGDLSTNLMRTLVIGGEGMSWGYSNPADPAGSTIDTLHAEYSSLALFNKIYKDESSSAPKRPPIVDRVLEDYKRLRNGNRRLSKLDKQRLDDHISRLDEIQRRLNVKIDCSSVQKPTADSEDLYSDTFAYEPDNHREFWGLLNDVIVAGLVCNTTQIVTLMAADLWTNQSAGWFSDSTLDWHQAVAHHSHEADRQPILVAAEQRFFEHVFLDLVTKLEAVVEPDQTTLLDSCLLFWTQESGCYTHDPIDLPVVMAGNAAGWLNTGSYVDYRNTGVTCHSGNDDPANEKTYAGLLYNQFLGTAMQAMGLEPADYEVNPGGGFGFQFEATETWYAGYQKYSSAVKQAAGQPLPFLKKA